MIRYIEGRLRTARQGRGFVETVSTGKLLWNRNPWATLSEFETTQSADEICPHPVDRAGCDRGLCMERSGRNYEAGGVGMRAVAAQFGVGVETVRRCVG
jgi:hypothetical protein